MALLFIRINKCWLLKSRFSPLKFLPGGFHQQLDNAVAHPDSTQQQQTQPIIESASHCSQLHVLTAGDKPIPLILEETVTLQPLINLSTQIPEPSRSHPSRRNKHPANLIPANLAGLKRLLWCYLCLICIVMERSQLPLIILYNLIPIIELNLSRKP